MPLTMGATAFTLDGMTAQPALEWDGMEDNGHPPECVCRSCFTRERGEALGQKLAHRIQRRIFTRRRAGRDWQERAANDALNAPW